MTDVLFAPIEARLNTADARLIRAEASAALNDAGAISPRVVDLYVGDLGTKAKIDPKTGDPIGIREHLDQWKEAHADFFRAPAQTTATASQTASTGSQQATVAGLPDLRGMDAKSRRTAVAGYRQSLRRASQGGDPGHSYQG